MSVSCTGCILWLEMFSAFWLSLVGEATLKSGCPGSTLVARDRMVPMILDSPALKGRSPSASSCSVGKCDMPSGGCGLPVLGGIVNGFGVVLALLR